MFCEWQQLRLLLLLSYHLAVPLSGAVPDSMATMALEFDSSQEVAADGPAGSADDAQGRHKQQRGRMKHVQGAKDEMEVELEPYFSGDKVELRRTGDVEALDRNYLQFLKSLHESKDQLLDVDQDDFVGLANHPVGITSPNGSQVQGLP